MTRLALLANGFLSIKVRDLFIWINGASCGSAATMGLVLVLEGLPIAGALAIAGAAISAVMMVPRGNPEDRP